MDHLDMDGASLTVERLGELYRAGYPAFLRVAEAITGDLEAARDAVHEGFVNAIRNRRSYRGAGPVEGWVWRCVVNAAKRTHRRRDDPVASPSDASASPPAEAYEEVAHAVARLPERQRLVLFLRYYGDLDYGSIAEALGITAGAVGASLHKAHRRLRNVLQEVDVARS